MAKTKIWDGNEMKWIRLTVWNVGDLYGLKKLNKLNNYLFKDTSQKIKIGMNEL